MLRIPNPGSDIDSFIRIYLELYDALADFYTFDLDDMSRTLVERNLATSSGFMGEEALSRSTRDDRSRDPLYNQSKMYSELLKVLGWIHPTKESALRFRVTFLGAQFRGAKTGVEKQQHNCVEPRADEALRIDLGNQTANLVVAQDLDHRFRGFGNLEAGEQIAFGVTFLHEPLGEYLERPDETGDGVGGQPAFLPGHARVVFVA
jgi:hypothetical protein